MLRRVMLVLAVVLLFALVAAPAMASTRVYSFSMDSDPDWTRDADWGYGACQWEEQAHTGTQVLGMAVDGEYPAPISMEYLTTDALDCSALGTVYLRFWRYLGYAEDTLVTVEVSNDGASWTTVWQTDGINYGWDDEWTECTYDISSVAAGQPAVYVRWGLSASSTCNCWGWNLDDVEIWDGAPGPPIADQTIYFNPLDSDPGWRADGQWAFGAPQGISGDPAAAATGSYVYGYNLAGAYSNNMGGTEWLVTSPINCTGFNNVSLRFQRWLGVETSAFDHASILVSNDYASWTTVWSNPGYVEDSSWVEVEYDISEVADGQPTVYIAWGMGPTDGSVVYWGWNIDDVELRGAPATEILAWVPYSSSEEYPNTLSALYNRYPWFNVTETTTLDPSELADQLAGKSVFLVPEQDDTDTATVQAAGSAFSDALRSFVQGGGTVIAAGGWESLDMGSFLASAGLMDAQFAALYYMGESLPVVDAAHPLAAGLGADIAATDSTAAYTVGPEATVVVEDGAGNAVVAVRQMGAGAVVLNGIDYYAWDGSGEVIIANSVQYPRAPKTVLLLDNGEPENHVAAEALNRLSLPFSVTDPDVFGDDIASGPWSLVIADVPDVKPTWDPLISYIGAGGHALLSTWELENEPALCSAFGVSAAPSLTEVPAVYDWESDAPLFSFREAVPSPISVWDDLWGVDANPLTLAASDAVGLAGFAATPTTGEAAVVAANSNATIIDGFLWDDRNQDNDADGLQDGVELVMNEIQMLLTVPFPDFTASVTDGGAPLSVHFTDLTGANVTGWLWDFGDGATSTAQNPTHSYTTAGPHTVSLTASNPNGSDMVRKVAYIAVDTTANFTATPTEGVAPLDVDFTDGSTSDTTSWAWDFGDGATSTAQNPSHQYAAPGKYTVTLDVTGGFGSDTEVKEKYIKVGFPDTPPGDFWAFDEVLDCVDAGVVSGYDDGLYHPDIVIDRALMATYTARAIAGGDASVPAGPATATFPDVATDFWAFKYIEYAVTNGVVQGYDDGNYHPEYLLDRGQMAVFIARAVAGDDASVPDGPATATFTDVPTDYWAYRHVEYCADQGIVTGYGGGIYNPAIQVTRDQMAVYVARALALMP